MRKNYHKKNLKETCREIWNSFLEELKIENIARSVRKGNFEDILKTFDSIRVIMNIAVDSISRNKELHSKGTFLYIYLHQARDVAIRSFLEALAGYYSCAYTLLRQAFESMIEGAYFECLAHKKFRENPNIPEITKKGASTLKGEIKEKIAQNRSIENKLEKESVYIFDILESIEKARKFKGKKKYLLLPSEMVPYLKIWKIFEPIPDPQKEWQEIYDRLSREAHSYPPYTEAGRRIVRFPQKDFLKVKVVKEELNEFLKWVKKVMDIGIVIELNILSDYIQRKPEMKKKILNWLTWCEKDLNLEFTPMKIKELIK